VEKTLANGLGEPVAGFDAYQRSLRKSEEEEGEGGEGLQNDEGALTYRLASLVAENWIPFIPVRPDVSSLNIQLEKAALLREKEGQAPEPIPARGRILNPGQTPYRVLDEEIPRASRRVLRRFQRTRWVDGSSHLWIGRHKKAGQGERASGLTFDLIEPRS
jgi:hypothetical protein